VSGSADDAEAWSRASYHPTPTIVEAARALYAQHSVEAIARFDAGAQNLHRGGLKNSLTKLRRKVASAFVLLLACPVPEKRWSV
jgi:hypothetical protein